MKTIDQTKQPATAPAAEPQADTEQCYCGSCLATTPHKVKVRYWDGSRLIECEYCRRPRMVIGGAR